MRKPKQIHTAFHLKSSIQIDRARPRPEPRRPLAVSVLAFLALPLLASAANTAIASDLCARVYKSSSAELLPAPSSSRGTLQRTLPIAKRLGFDELIGEGREIDNVVPSPDHHLVAVVHSGNSPMKVDVFDIQTGQTVFSDNFTQVKSVSFIPDSDLIAINGTKKSDGKISKLYILPMSGDKGQQEVAKKDPSSATNLPAMFQNPFLQFWSGFLTTPESSTLRTKNPETLDLPASPNWGAHVNQIVARRDLPYVFVVQDSSNALKTVYLPDTPPGADPHSSLLNKGTYLFDPTSMRRVDALNYDGLTPNEMNLNPHSTLAALNLVDPIVAHRSKNIIALIDTRHPNDILYQFDLSEKGKNQGQGSRRLTNQWSHDGRKLIMVEKDSGTVATYDLSTQKETVSERNDQSRWPISGSLALSDGSLLVLRQGEGPSDAGRDPSKRIFGYIVKSVTALDEFTAPDFELKYDPSKDLFPQTMANPQKALIEPQSIFEMQNGQTLVVILDGQVIAISRKSPQDQIALHPIPNAQQKSHRPIISSAQKLNESILRLSDYWNGVFDVKIP